VALVNFVFSVRRDDLRFYNNKAATLFDEVSPPHNQVSNIFWKDRNSLSLCFRVFRRPGSILE